MTPIRGNCCGSEGGVRPLYVYALWIKINKTTGSMRPVNTAAWTVCRVADKARNACIYSESEP